MYADIAVVIALGLLLGGVISRLSIESDLGFGSQTIGQWTAWPKAGSSESDPYTRAKVAAGGEVPLGAAEGIAFHAKRDEEGRTLDLSCSYIIEGNTPTARLWTLTAHGLGGSVIADGLGGASALNSRQIVRNYDGSFRIVVGPYLTVGNWLRTSGDGLFELVLRLYDSPITASAGIIEPNMPSLRRTECAA